MVLSSVIKKNNDRLYTALFVYKYEPKERREAT